jgi:rubrerythrin
MKELTPKQEDYLEEEAREKYFEQKQKSKDKVICEFCGFEYSGKECPACEETLKFGESE